MRPSERLDQVDPELERTVDQRQCDLASSHTSGGEAQSEGVRPPMVARDAIDARALHALAQERYGDLELLGSGGEGHVFAATDRSFDRQIALKVIRDSRFGDIDKMARFIQEARVTAQLQHPNILPIYDLDITADGRPYFTMQRARGRNLDELIADESLDWPLTRCLEVFTRVCDAVAYAHSHGIIHQDIKPSNILIGDFGEVLLVDWGTALTAEDRAAASPRIMGTPMYMSPEQAACQQVDERSDIYCLGGTLLRLLSGRFAVDGEDNEGFWAKKRAGIIDVTPEDLPDVPRHLQETIFTALAPDPADRFANVAELQQAIATYQVHSASIRMTEEAQAELDRDGQDFFRLAHFQEQLQEAIRLWPDNNDAAVVLRTCRRRIIGLALRQGDMALAERTYGSDPEGLSDQATAISHQRQRQRWQQHRARMAWFGLAAAMVLGLAVMVLLIDHYRDRQTAWQPVFAGGAQAIADGSFSGKASMLIESEDVALQADAQTLELDDGNIIWFEGAELRGDVQLSVDVTWLQEVDGLGIMLHADRTSMTSPWSAPSGYVCQFGGFNGTENFISINIDPGGLDRTLAVPSHLVPQRRYTCTFAYRDHYLTMSIDGAEVSRRRVILPVSGAENARVGIRSWGRVAIHRLEIDRRTTPRAVAPTIAGDVLFARGEQRAAYHWFRSLVTDHSGSALARTSIAKAYHAADALGDPELLQDIEPLLAGLEESDPELWRHCRQLQAVRLWRRGQAAEGLAMAAALAEEEPGSRIHDRLIFAAKPPDTSSAAALLKDLARFQPDRQALHLKEWPLQDLTPLASLPLKVLNVAECAISDLQPLAHMALERLDLSKTGVSDLSVLAGMPLKSLSIADTTIADLTPLRGAPLQRLVLSRTQVSDCSAISTAPLQELSASSSKLITLKGLEAAPLQRCDISRTGVTDLGPTRGWPLEVLSAEETPITSLRGLPVTHLSYLDLKACAELHDFSALQGAARLENLDISGTLADDLDFLAGCSALQTLRASDCRIEDPGPLAALPVRHVTLARNRIDTVTALEHCLDTLQHLDISHNQVTTLGALLDSPPPAFVFHHNPLGVDAWRLIYESWRNHPDHQSLLADNLLFFIQRHPEYRSWLKDILITWQEHYYLPVRSRMTQDEALALVASLNGYIAEVDSRAEMNFLKRLIRSRAMAFIGMRRGREGDLITGRGQPPAFIPDDIRSSNDDPDRLITMPVRMPFTHWAFLGNAQPVAPFVIEWDDLPAFARHW